MPQAAVETGKFYILTRSAATPFQTLRSETIYCRTSDPYFSDNICPMKLSGIVAVLSLAVVGSTLVFVAVASHDERLPNVYYSLDKSKPWNELARGLDPQMSDGEYDTMRTRYFYDVVAPKVSANFSKFGTYEEFMQLTERPWRWDRRPSRGEPPKVVQLVFWVSAAYLVVFLLMWSWRRVLKPGGLIVRDDGLAGVAQIVLHGRRSRPPE